MALNNSTDDNFDKEVLGSPIPSVVTFSASWCGPCKANLPILQKLALELNGKFKFFYHLSNYLTKDVYLFLGVSFISLSLGVFKAIRLPTLFIMLCSKFKLLGAPSFT